MTKYFFFITALAFLLNGCTSQEDLKDDTPALNQAVESPSAASEEGNGKTEPSLPSPPKKSHEEIAKELGIKTENLSMPTEIIDVKELISKQPSSQPDSQLLEVMNPKSNTSCESYEAQMLKQICYNARGLSSDTNNITPANGE